MSNTVPTLADRLSAATVTAENASALLHRIVHGASNETVPTESGDVPTLAKWYLDLDDRTAGALRDVLEALNQLTTDLQNVSEEAVQRSNHTGEQPISTITGLADALNAAAQKVVSLAVTYNEDGSAADYTENGVIKTLTYNAAGDVQSIAWTADGVTTTQTMVYDEQGNFMSMTTSEVPA